LERTLSEDQTDSATVQPTAYLKFSDEENTAYALGELLKMDFDLFREKHFHTQTTMAVMGILCRLLAQPKDEKAVLRQLIRGYARRGGDFSQVTRVFDVLGRCGFPLMPKFALIQIGHYDEESGRDGPYFPLWPLGVKMWGDNEDADLVIQEMLKIKRERVQRRGQQQ